MNTVTIVLLVLLSIFFPPGTAFILSGCSADLLINIVLSFLGFIPGLLHAFWLIWKRAEAEETYGIGGYRYLGNGTYEGHTGLGGVSDGHQHIAQQPPQTYGSTMNQN
ncbi:hypothetical protein BKA62DRAFT_720796 [Auriculariales sp. MPI-PUGE-AT-0066]|nr:hypothetical protein BKA62DRAFT_720796 [Auriculariales sp. MPI-PUGE-AT-0066]